MSDVPPLGQDAEEKGGGMPLVKGKDSHEGHENQEEMSDVKSCYDGKCLGVLKDEAEDIHSDPLSAAKGSKEESLHLRHHVSTSAPDTTGGVVSSPSSTGSEGWTSSSEDGRTPSSEKVPSQVRDSPHPGSVVPGFQNELTQETVTKGGSNSQDHLDPGGSRNDLELPRSDPSMKSDELNSARESKPENVGDAGGDDEGVKQETCNFTTATPLSFRELLHMFIFRDVCSEEMEESDKEKDDDKEGKWLVCVCTA